MNTFQNDFSLGWAISVIRRWIWMILGVTVITAIIAYAVLALIPSKYEAGVTLLVEPSRSSTTSDYSTLLAAQQLAITYSEMVTSRPILETVISEVGLKISPESLAAKIKSTSIRETQLIRVTVQDSDPQQATKIANAIASAFATNMKRLQAERYAETIKGIQAKIANMGTNIEQTQAKIDLLNAEKAKNNSEIARLESTLEEQRTKYGLLEQNYQTLQNSIVTLNDNIKVYEVANVSQLSSGYRATTTLLVRDPSVAISTQSSVTASKGVENIAKIYQEMITRPAVISAALSKLELKDNPQALANSVFVEPVDGTQLYRVNVINNDAKKAEKLANAITESFINITRSQLLAPYTNSVTGVEEQIGTLNQQMGQTQAGLKEISSQNAAIDSQLDVLNTSLSEYRTDFRTFQMDLDDIQITAVAASDNVVVTEPAPLGKSVQRRTLYMAVALFTALVIAIVLAFLFEILTQWNKAKNKEVLTVARVSNK